MRAHPGAEMSAPKKKKKKKAPTRLPVQHPSYPHCANCKAPLPTFDGAMISDWANLNSYEMLGVTYHVRCACGTPWDLRKNIKK